MEENTYYSQTEEQINVEVQEQPIKDIEEIIDEKLPIQKEEIIMNEELPIQEEVNIIVETAPTTEEVTRPTNVYVKVNFPKSATPVDCVSATTNCSDKIVASNKQLALLQNRFYFIPVDCDVNINSDEYSIIKVYSEYADAIDVRYIKDGFACIMPLKHNFKVRQDMLLAILF